MKHVYLFIADGTEECEALITVDLLRRANINVKTVSVMNDICIKSSSNIQICADYLIDQVNLDDADMLILPGGMPGTKYLKKCKKLLETIIEFDKNNKPLAAICAAPSVLGKLGLLKGKNAICYPGFEKTLKGATISKTDPVTDGNITTASGLGHAIPFALEIIKVLRGSDTAKKIAKQIVY